MIHVGEWISKEIRRLCHRLDTELFMLKDERERIKGVLSVLLTKRARLHEHQERMAEEKRKTLKNPEI